MTLDTRCPHGCGPIQGHAADLLIIDEGVQFDDPAGHRLTVEATPRQQLMWAAAGARA